MLSVNAIPVAAAGEELLRGSLPVDSKDRRRVASGRAATTGDILTSCNVPLVVSIAGGLFTATSLAPGLALALALPLALPVLVTSKPGSRTAKEGTRKEDHHHDHTNIYIIQNSETIYQQRDVQ